MNYTEARDKFISAWGTLGSSWGINRTMAQIHALLLLAPEPMDTDDIMAALEISRGNANMNIRALIDWGLLYKEYKQGDRKEYFRAEKDTWKIAKRVADRRRQQELVPVIRLLDELDGLQANAGDSAAEELKKVTGSVRKLATKTDSFLETFSKAEEHWLFDKLMR